MELNLSDLGVCSIIILILLLSLSCPYCCCFCGPQACLAWPSAACLAIRTRGTLSCSPANSCLTWVPYSKPCLPHAILPHHPDSIARMPLLTTVTQSLSDLSPRHSSSQLPYPLPVAVHTPRPLHHQEHWQPWASVHLLLALLCLCGLLHLKVSSSLQLTALDQLAAWDDRGPTGKARPLGFYSASLSPADTCLPLPTC